MVGSWEEEWFGERSQAQWGCGELRAPRPVKRNSWLLRERRLAVARDRGRGALMDFFQKQKKNPEIQYVTILIQKKKTIMMYQNKFHVI